MDEPTQFEARTRMVLTSEDLNTAMAEVMRLDTEGHDDDKIIVRSNGTVTYVGKDIAYQLWKLGLLQQDFKYEVFDGAAEVWVTTATGGQETHPQFGRGDTVH